MMQSQEITIDRIYDINYPCYIVAIPEGTRVTSIPGEFEYDCLEQASYYVLEAIKTENKYYIFDAIPAYLWNKKRCDHTYEKRLGFVRRVVFDTLAQPDKVMDLDSVLVDNPAELLDYIDNLLTQGYKKVMIRDVNGYYVFGQSTQGESLELNITQELSHVEA